MIKKKGKIIFCAGGTAGHVFPAVALAAQLKEQNCNIVLITDKRGFKYVKTEFDKVYKLPVSRLGLMLFLKSPYLFLKSLFILITAKKIICFGGYVSFFPFIVALLLGKKRVIYQLDSHVTRLNRWLIPFANEVFYGFPQTDLKKEKNTYCFGIPVRTGFEFSYIEKGEFLNIAIIGGSLGSNYWKDLLMDTLLLLPNNIRSTIKIRIQTSENLDFLKQFNLASYEKQIFYDTAQLFKQSHLIIARAGAASIAEMSSVARAAYLVPWENALEDHQYHNAKVYAKSHGAEFGKSGQQLANYIIKIAQSSEFFYQVCENASRAMPQFAKNKAGAFINAEPKI
jgi:UDP-N-acetylglucosamine--N-acetylmuramyl-(pentapeptide) pyrophosphoryl-undecaprenol N-acetylglucosamine transferase